MRAIVTTLKRRFGRLTTFVVWGLFTVAATVMGPFDTLSIMGPERRSLYWCAIVGLALLVSGLIERAALRIAPDPTSWRHDVLRITGMTVVFSPVVYGWTLFYLPDRAGHTPNLWTIACFVLLIGTVVRVSLRVIRGEAGRALAVAPQDPPPETAPDSVQADSALSDPAPADPAPRLLRRLPDGSAGPVLRLTASGHFVEIVLPEGSHSVRMRFTDAIDEMDGIEGYCAHRSHWVARAAIQQVERDSARTFLRLSNGDQVPVSRTYRPGLEQAGIL